MAKGHGTLNAIYAATTKACEARNWAGVDVLIIGGDFQVRVDAHLGRTQLTGTRQLAMSSISLSCPSQPSTVNSETSTNTTAANVMLHTLLSSSEEIMKLAVIFGSSTMEVGLRQTFTTWEQPTFSVLDQYG